MVYLQDSKIKIGSADQVAKVFQDLLLLEDKIDQAKEHFYVAHLDVRSRVNLVELVSLGSQSSAIVHPRETFRRAVIEGAASSSSATTIPHAWLTPQRRIPAQPNA